jgi:hypothetical protein
VPFEHGSHAEVTGANGRRQAGGRAVRRLEYIGDETWLGVGNPPGPPTTRVWVLGVPTRTRRHDVVLRGAASEPGGAASGSADDSAGGSAGDAGQELAP